ncbi:MAG: hypothetical protein L6R39_003720 [Caloplaca ligustica]|nr:MAG: hypothetical protein L6R39_003720 [Caloplaca ligustica]
MAYNSDKTEFRNYNKPLTYSIGELNHLVEPPRYYDPATKDFIWRTVIAITKGQKKTPATDDYSEFFDSWLLTIKEYADIGSEAVFSMTVAALAFDISSCFGVTGRAAFWTENGYLGLGPPATQPGDSVCILLGVTTSYLLRENHNTEGKGRTYQLVGECYIHGLMNGEGLKIGEEQDITLT